MPSRCGGGLLGLQVWLPDSGHFGAWEGNRVTRPAHCGNNRADKLFQRPENEWPRMPPTQVQPGGDGYVSMLLRGEGDLRNLIGRRIEWAWSLPLVLCRVKEGKKPTPLRGQRRNAHIVYRYLVLTYESGRFTLLCDGYSMLEGVDAPMLGFLATAPLEPGRLTLDAMDEDTLRRSHGSGGERRAGTWWVDPAEATRARRGHVLPVSSELDKCENLGITTGIEAGRWAALLLGASRTAPPANGGEGEEAGGIERHRSRDRPAHHAGPIQRGESDGGESDSSVDPEEMAALAREDDLEEEKQEEALLAEHKEEVAQWDASKARGAPVRHRRDECTGSVLRDDVRGIVPKAFSTAERLAVTGDGALGKTNKKPANEARLRPASTEQLREGLSASGFAFGRWRLATPGATKETEPRTIAFFMSTRAPPTQAAEQAPAAAAKQEPQVSFARQRFCRYVREAGTANYRAFRAAGLFADKTRSAGGHRHCFFTGRCGRNFHERFSFGGAPASPGRPLEPAAPPPPPPASLAPGHPMRRLHRRPPPPRRPLG